MTYTTFDTHDTDPVNFTDHAAKRCDQRGITATQAGLAIDYGKKLYRQGMIFHFLRGKDIPPWIAPHAMGRMKNLMVVTPTDTARLVITVYRNVKGLRQAKRKPPYLLK